jgi:glycosyltransferase involved in cell wall biosynthesis
VSAQTYDDFDIHIVDDGSSDETPVVVENLLADNDNQYYWRHDKRRGLAAARNMGIANSSAEYIAFLDDDDEWKPKCLGRRIKALEELSDAERDRVGVVYCGCEIHIVDENHIFYNMPKIEGNIRENLLRRNLSTIPSSCLFSRAALERVGGFDENLCSSIDHDIWMGLAAHEYHALAVTEPLVITYYIRNRTTMVTDVTPRIRGVEQYLDKWGPTFEQWFGGKKGRDHVRKYRARVLGNLAGVKLGQGSFRQAHQLVRHVIRKNKLISLNQITLTKMITLSVLRECMPVWLKRILRSMRGLIRKNAC